MKRSLQGKYIKTNTTGETVNAFIPAPLPPDPPIDWGNGLRNRFDNALLALGRLDGVALLLPDINTRRIRRTTYKNGKKHPTSPLISWRCRSPE